jgi:hypothetical protein
VVVVGGAALGSCRQWVWGGSEADGLSWCLRMAVENKASTIVDLKAQSDLPQVAAYGGRHKVATPSRDHGTGDRR